MVLFFCRNLDEDIRFVVRGQTNVGHEGRQVGGFLLGVHWGHVLLGPTGLSWLLLLLLLLLLLFTCSIGNQLFSVGLVDQLFQPTRNPVKLVENDRYWLLSQSWALIRCVMSTNAILFSTVGVWYPLSPGIPPCFAFYWYTSTTSTKAVLGWTGCSPDR